MTDADPLVIAEAEQEVRRRDDEIQYLDGPVHGLEAR